MEKLINRARALMSVCTEVEAAAALMASGADAGSAFLAVKAAVAIDTDDDLPSNRPGMMFRDPETMAQIKLEAEYDERHCRD